MHCSSTVQVFHKVTVCNVEQLYISEETKSIKKRKFPAEYVGIVADLHTVLSTSHHLGADSALKGCRLEALEYLRPAQVTELNSHVHVVGFPPSTASV